MKPTGEIYAAGGQPAFTPEDLFLNGEQGAWYDPSDLTTMFQDRAGTTPVTADGQTVGLILDKSQGLAIGPELVTNGTFDTTTTGWSTGFGGVALSVVSAQMQVSTTTAYGRAFQSFTTTVGKTYLVSGTARRVSGAGVAFIGYSTDLVDASAARVIGDTTSATDVQIQGFFVADATSYAVTCGDRFGDTNCVYVFDNISVKELPGNHAVAPSDAARPLKTSTGAADWTNYDAVDDVLNTTFTSSLGSSCTVCRANVGAAPTILTAQTIGTSYADSTDNAGLIIINRALTAQETTDVTAWLTEKGGT